MGLPVDLISEFVKITNDKTEKRQESTLYGTAKIVGDQVFVKFDGADVLTPAVTTVTAKDGERVSILLKNHTALITGNMTAPSARNEDVVELTAAIGNFDVLIANKASISDLEVERGRIDTLVSENVTIKNQLTANAASIGELKADNATIKETLTAQNGDIENLKTKKLDAETAEITYAKAEDFKASNAELYNLKTAYGNFENLTSEKFTAYDASISKLNSNVAEIVELQAGYATIGKVDALEGKIKTIESNYLKAGDLEAGYAKIDFSNVGVEWIEDGKIKNGAIGSAAIHDGAITNAKIADATIEAAKINSVNADNITVGTLKTERLLIADGDGGYSIVKAINMANGVAEADANGTKFEAASIEVVDLSAFQAKIAGFEMSNSAIYIGKESINDAHSGIYISTTGFGMGDASLTGSNESPLQAYPDGSFKLVGKNGSFDFNGVLGNLEINASKILLKSKAVATEDSVTAVSNRVTTATSQIEQNANEIVLRVKRSEFDDLSSSIEQINSFISSIQGWQYRWDKILNGSSASPETHTDYISFVNGDIILGESSSKLKLKLSNDSIQFKGDDSNSEITPDVDTTAWITGRKFNIGAGEIHKLLKIGRLQFVPRRNGNMSLILA